MTPRRLVLVVAVAGCVLVPGASAAHTPAPATFTVSAAGKKALKQRAVTLKSVPGGLKLPVGTATFGASATVQLGGTLRFASGKRKVDATRLSVTVGRTSSYVTARLGTTSVRLLTVTPTRPSVLDAPGKRVSVIGARIALTSAAAKRLKTALRLKRTPSTTSLGTFSMTVAPHDHGTTTLPAPMPTPAPTAVATPTPTATATPTPEPPPPCAPLFAATPAGSADWFGCDLPGGGDLKSWTNYVLSDFPPIAGCQDVPGTIVASAGAARIQERSPYDHRLSIVSSQFEPDGSGVIDLSGTITYTMPVHGIDETITPRRIEIAAGRTDRDAVRRRAGEAARHGQRRLHDADPAVHEQPRS